MLWKEFAHIRRERSTIFFMIVVPVLQTFIFGYAIQTDIEHIPTVIYNLDGRTESRLLVEAFQNTRTFEIRQQAYDEDSFRRAMTSGRAKVGILIPPDYTDRLLHGQQTQVQVLIDGSDSQVATTALNTANLLGTSRSMNVAKNVIEAQPMVPARDEKGRLAIPVEIRARLLYNPALESSHFFVPGLVGSASRRSPLSAKGSWGRSNSCSSLRWDDWDSCWERLSRIQSSGCSRCCSSWR
jgi:hypothetical protein